MVKRAEVLSQDGADVRRVSETLCAKEDGLDRGAPVHGVARYRSRDHVPDGVCASCVSPGSPALAVDKSAFGRLIPGSAPHPLRYGRHVTVKAEVVSSIADYVRFLLDRGATARHWFRGQGCHHRTLRPSLLRRLDPYTPAEMIAREMALITRFRQRSLPMWPEGYPQDDWEQLFAMQHFGVPTRLLDWSENATIAAYFAADHDPGRCECEGLLDDCRPTVWVLDPVRLNRLNSRLDGYGDAIGILSTNAKAIEPWAPGTEETRFAPWPVALHGTHNSARIVAQQGTFTVMGKQGSPLETAPAVMDADDVLTKIVFNVDHAELMRELRTIGVTRPTIYPDLPSVAYDITVEELGS